MLIDIKAVKDEASKQINEEFVNKAKGALVAQMRIVAAAREVVRREEVKLQDIEARITEGTL